MSANLNRLLCLFFAVVAFTGISVAVQSEANLKKVTADLSLIQNPIAYPLTSQDLAVIPAGSDWRGVRSNGPDVSFIAAGNPVKLSASLDDPASAENIAINLAREITNGWLNDNRLGFIPSNTQKLKNLWVVNLQQTYGGIPVYGAKLTVRITADGRLSSLSSRLFPTELVNSSFSLNPETALTLLSDLADTRLSNSRKVLFPVDHDGVIELIPAWQLLGESPLPEYRPAGLVDAQSGAVLMKYNNVAFDDVSGTVLGLVLPHYWDDEPQVWPMTNQQVYIGSDNTYTDDNGDYLFTPGSGTIFPIIGQLYGHWVNVNWEDGDDATYIGEAIIGQPHNWIWDYTMGRQDELNMYYHVDFVHGFYDILDPPFSGLDFPLPAIVGYGDNYENAFWNGNGIFFGEGAGTFRNFALFCDVIYHEYTHGVTDHIYPWYLLPYTGEPGAMNEGWSDYFACTITDESQMGEGGLFTNGQVMRDLDNTLRMPENWAGEVHADGRIIGGAFWDLRELLGASSADSLLHFAKYLWSETFEDYFVDVLVTADDDGDLSNGGPYHNEIYEAFDMHGIGPGLAPILEITPTDIVENGTGGSVGNGDGFFDPNEVLSMTFSISDLRWLYPPAAEDVTVTVTSEDPDLSFAPQIFIMGDVPAGGMVQAPTNLLITIAADAELCFTDIVFEISANGGSYTVTDQIEIIVGHPEIVVIDDDGGMSYENFYDTALRNYDQVFALYEVAASGEVPLDYLNSFDAVFWFTGDELANTLTGSDRVNLADYLDNGGNLFLSGQNLVEDIGPSAFFSDYLKADPIEGDIPNGLVLEGVPGDPITDEQWVMIFGA
ncbi:M36 family metallopeptidase, partial [bacterium]|nr:M36 family metallopeptidase [bacterium]